MQLRLNSPYDFFIGNVLNADATAPAAGTFWTKKLMYQHSATDAGGSFPKNWASNTAGTTEIPWWRQYWATMYSYYTVLGCEYELTITNPGSSQRHCLVAHTIETDGTTGALTTRTNLPLKDLYGQKNIQFDKICATTTISTPEFLVIKGTYKPGSAKRNIQNDGDVKTWTQTGATPTFRELLQVMFYQHPLGTGGASSTIVIGCNIQVRLKWIVQFKDLTENYSMPSNITGSSSIQTMPTDALPKYNQV